MSAPAPPRTAAGQIGAATATDGPEVAGTIAQLGPEIGTPVGSRGAVLVALGRHQEERFLPETVRLTDYAEPFGTVMHRIFLARANGLMAQVRSVTAIPDSVPPETMALIERIEREMQTRP